MLNGESFIWDANGLLYKYEQYTFSRNYQSILYSYSNIHGPLFIALGHVLNKCIILIFYI
jgi:hypothetical protein